MSDSIYAKPVLPRIIVRPILATVALHALMLFMLTANWSGIEEQRTIKPRLAPKVIKARLVDASELKPKKVAKPAAKPKVVEKVEPKPEPRLTAEELAAIARSELSQAIESETQAQEALTADELAASYAALIQQTVVSYWSRPPSARNGMEVLLALQLIPTGEVVSVTVVKSSGNTAFDRSAVNAVQKAEQFPELKDLPSREFEKTFRRFRLLFRPEDLRY